MHLRLFISRASLIVIGCCSAQEMEIDIYAKRGLEISYHL